MTHPSGPSTRVCCNKNIFICVQPKVIIYPVGEQVTVLMLRQVQAVQIFSPVKGVDLLC